MAPVRSYTNWNSRTTDEEEQIEPYRKYFSYVRVQIPKHGISKS